MPSSLCVLAIFVACAIAARCETTPRELASVSRAECVDIAVFLNQSHTAHSLDLSDFRYAVVYGGEQTLVADAHVIARSITLFVQTHLVPSRRTRPIHFVRSAFGAQLHLSYCEVSEVFIDDGIGLYVHGPDA